MSVVVSKSYWQFTVTPLSSVELKVLFERFRVHVTPLHPMERLLHSRKSISSTSAIVTVVCCVALAQLTRTCWSAEKSFTTHTNPTIGGSRNATVSSRLGLT